MIFAWEKAREIVFIDTSHYLGYVKKECREKVKKPEEFWKI